MKNLTTKFTSIVLAAALSCGAGCASYRTISTAEPSTPKVFSGTRLDVHAILHNERGLRQFKTEPPLYPWLDLPFSVLLDMAVLPLSLSIALYQVVFE